ncbi:hypothetical protein HPSA20_1720 [Helicobacter pylori SouthAfrica20]|uniref:Uncharacterized protein n=1 Tax=Helicobacter pylori SouthAfrica20 TaxID=1352356 RepID=T1UDF1_HELPX|nr:hypothetical protein HPSA20_1720 [Helicobacter pylori SouthAfrica20]
MIFLRWKGVFCAIPPLRNNAFRNDRLINASPFSFILKRLLAF